MIAADALQQRLDSLRQSTAFRNYQYVLERVLRMRELGELERSPVAAPSDYWQEELANFDYMFDASPLIIGKLRHHTYHITGLRVYDYRSNKDEAGAQFAHKLLELVEIGGRDLLVPESRALGGFGFDIEGELYNIDTLKFYEVLIALDKGAVLADFRGGGERRLVWEIGAGWGGFPYQFKKVCPNSTYVISDFPELFLFSAVYLMTLFPEARVGFYGEEPTDRLLSRWDEYDFIFLPNTALERFEPPRLDLTINMVSFQEMTTEQVEAYVERAFQLNCPFLYSLNRDHSAYNTQLTSVTSVIERFYWPHEILVLSVPYNKTSTKPDKAAAKAQKEARAQLKAKAKAARAYKHIVGWRRILT
jgi:hypothetical protein